MDVETKKEFDKVHQSIADLAAAMVAGFTQVDKRFEQVDQRFEQVDQRFDRLEADLKSLREEPVNPA